MVEQALSNSIKTIRGKIFGPGHWDIGRRIFGEAFGLACRGGSADCVRR